MINYTPVGMVYNILRRNSRSPIMVETKDNFYVTGKLKSLKKRNDDVEMILSDAVTTKRPINIGRYELVSRRGENRNVRLYLFRDTLRLQLL